MLDAVLRFAGDVLRIVGWAYGVKPPTIDELMADGPDDVIRLPDRSITIDIGPPDWTDPKIIKWAAAARKKLLERTLPESLWPTAAMRRDCEIAMRRIRDDLTATVAGSPDANRRISVDVENKTLTLDGNNPCHQVQECC
jgi:hypothetical protein